MTDGTPKNPVPSPPDHPVSADAGDSVSNACVLGGDPGDYQFTFSWNWKKKGRLPKRGGNFEVVVTDFKPRIWGGRTTGADFNIALIPSTPKGAECALQAGVWLQKEHLALQLKLHKKSPEALLFGLNKDGVENLTRRWCIRDLGETAISAIIEGQASDGRMTAQVNPTKLSVPNFVRHWCHDIEDNGSFTHSGWEPTLTLKVSGSREKDVAEWPQVRGDNGLYSESLLNAVSEVTDAEGMYRARTRIVIMLAVWRAMAHLSLYGNGESFPRERTYVPQRPVDLDARSVIKGLEEKGFDFPWHVVEATCTALNAGKHLILTGPPGCGKTSLAEHMALAAAKGADGAGDPLIATASPAWSTGELIGRYMPDISLAAGAGFRLVFRPGLFLKALGSKDSRADRWLIIDEMNRADIDKCFGELFTVLAGGSVTLPFEQVLTDTEAEGDDVQLSEIVVGQADNEQADYRIQPFFRMIGTMNDADRSGLNQLSFALQRRFVMIRVEAPSDSRICDFMKKKVTEVWGNAFGDGTISPHSLGSGNTPFKEDDFLPAPENSASNKRSKAGAGVVFRALSDLFAKEQEDITGETDIENDLVDFRLVGMATIVDVLRFLVESVRAPIGDKKESVKVGQGSVTVQRWKERLLFSSLALAVVLHVFPQLDVYLQTDASNKLKVVLELLRKVFSDTNNSSRKMYRIAPTAAKSSLELREEEEITTYFRRELRRQFAQYPEYLVLVEEILGGNKERL